MIRKSRSALHTALLATLILSTPLVGGESGFPLYRASTIELPASRTAGFSYVFGPGALNDHGQFVGNFSDSLGDRAFLWDANGYTELPLESANDINNASQVVGVAPFSGGSRAVVWEDGHIIDLGALSGDNSSYGSAINDTGHVAGSSGDFPNRRAFYWDGTALHPIGEFFPTDINDLNEIVGFPPSGPGILWRNGVSTQFNGFIINNALHYPSNGGMWDGEQFVCFDGSSVCDTNMLGADINENDDVVGVHFADAFIWNQELGLRHLIDLLDPTDPFSAKISNLQCPDAINNNRQIVLSCATVEGIESELGYVPILLTPIDKGNQHAVTVPFPVALTVSYAALLILVGLKSGNA